MEKWERENYGELYQTKKKKERIVNNERFYDVLNESRNIVLCIKYMIYKQYE